MDGFERYVGLVFDNRYKIEKIIGIGGMAVVYKAIDLLMRRVVAVKMLKDEIAADEQSVRRFINESKAVAMLSHPNIVNIYDVSVRDNVKYIVMEYVEGITLKNYMTHKGILSLREIISYSEQILNALDHAHTKGIVHRDIKPHNIMLLKNGRIKVMDFGIAKLPNAETVTMTDKAIGTVYYISPEQASGMRIDSRSDLYSLGVLMYEMSCGRLPFNADSPVSVALMQVNDNAVPPRKLNPRLPVGLEQIIQKAMEKDPEERYQSAALMLRHITRLKENPHVIFKEVQKSLRKKEKKKKPHRASHAMLPIILGVAFAFLLVCGITGYYILNMLFFSEDTSKAETITVQTFTGKYYTDELEEWFSKSEYYTLQTEFRNDPLYEEGMIIDQTPSGGDRRKVVAGEQKCPVTLIISKGAETVVVPDVLLYDYREAEMLLEDLDLIVSTKKVYSENFAVGTVISMEPEPGTTLKLNDKVTIYVSQGTAVGSIVVPDFTGLTESQALRKIIQTGLRVGTVTYEANEKPAGTVIDQSLKPTVSVVHANTKIDFIVSGGPDWKDPNAPVVDPSQPPVDPNNPDKPGTVVDPNDPYAGWEPEDGFSDEKPADTTSSDAKKDAVNQAIKDFVLDMINNQGRT
ncbi:MAG: PASTA domain-containing protein [Ruminococcaceae bacterium]|nr:PASTA domain-containing protein [Oscillospiraceae bacterium]